MIRTHLLQRISGMILFLLIAGSLFLAGCPGSSSESATIPNAPAGQSALAGDGLIVLGWKASAGATSYNVYLAESPLVTKSTYTTLPGGTKITGAMSPYTVTGLTNGTTYYAVVTAVNSTGESGESGLSQGTPGAGSGDTGNYMPVTAGNTWHSNVTITSSDAPDESFTRTSTISGTRTINGATALVLSETDSNAPNITEEDYGLKDSNGIILLGTNDTTDLLTPQMVPYFAIKFPIATGSNYTQVNKTGLDWGEDLDGDGINEQVDFTSTVSVALEPEVIVPAGTFQNCPKEEATITIAVKLSKTGSFVMVYGTITTWYASGVGPIKVISTTNIPSAAYSDTETEEVTYYMVH